MEGRDAEAKEACHKSVEIRARDLEVVRNGGKGAVFQGPIPCDIFLDKIQLAIQISIEEFGEYLICSS